MNLFWCQPGSLHSSAVEVPSSVLGLLAKPREDSPRLEVSLAARHLSRLSPCLSFPNRNNSERAQWERKRAGRIRSQLVAWKQMQSILSLEREITLPAVPGPPLAPAQPRSQAQSLLFLFTWF
ncbi:hypothetical protein KIL84_006034 [Mauremys mutica]|uniref:Uncharacterized protein n=1 Tax=Mauremys mutica TaxID=74926 RepID=A0A9D4B4A8_9SAUR|nr:hypothetical protein KIL84_006034 [Mauremys mutica]